MATSGSRLLAIRVKIFCREFKQASEVQNLQHGSHNSLKPNEDSISDLQASEVPAEALLEVAETRRVYEKGGIFLDDGYDDVILRDLIGCNDVDNEISSGK
ncbi:hypothetical protein PIB30_018964 [Stylosanthes scabra]|uniref:Uncharacterized protein n=1 Tax=Stylosanthes scabra TaxID=79078 RepID=A0ABU6Z728_9FABA|nr:hypothetical protein [Stylosanthes scabra]